MTVRYKFTPLRQMKKFYSSVIQAVSAVEQIGLTLASQEAMVREIQSCTRELSHGARNCAQSIQGKNVTPVSTSFERAPALVYSQLQSAMGELRRSLTASMPENPVGYGWKSYSQCDEDGIIRECLRRIATVAELSDTFIEVGCGNGLENNTHQLALDGFAGCWVDGDASKIRSIKDELGDCHGLGLQVHHSFVTLDSIQHLMTDCRAFLGTSDIDFFSFDVDGNDTHLVRSALTFIKPKLICVEYNAKFRPPTRIEMKYSAAHLWDGDDYFGASLQAWVDTLDGYLPVACNLSGANAFFVRKDLASAFQVYTIDELYQPPRYWLVGNDDGHRPSLKWLRQTVSATKIDRPWVIEARVEGLPPFDFEIHRRADRYISADLLRTHIWEPFETEIFCRLCRPADFVVDIGGNIGWYSVLASKMIGNSGRLMSFEPDPENFSLLSRNVSRCSETTTVELRQEALGETTSSVTLFQSATNLGDHRIFDDGTLRASVEVSLNTLDRLLENESRWPDIVKSDTQGSEVRILEGARQTLAKGWRPVFLLEFWPFGLAGAGSDPLALWTDLLALGYRMYEVSEATPRLISLTEQRMKLRMSTDITPESGGFINILALPSGSSRRTAIQELID